MDFFPDYELELGNVQQEAKLLISFLVCPVHKKKCKVTFDYDNTGVNAYVEKCCCQKLGEVAYTLLASTGKFQEISINYI